MDFLEAIWLVIATGIFPPASDFHTNILVRMIGGCWFSYTKAWPFLVLLVNGIV